MFRVVTHLQVDGTCIYIILFTGYEDNGKFIVPRDDDYLYVFNDAEPQETVAVSGQ